MGTDKVRWVLNKETGNVKHWNENMVGVANMIECTEEGIPLDVYGAMKAYEDKMKKKNNTEAMADAKAKYYESIKEDDTEDIDGTGDVGINTVEDNTVENNIPADPDLENKIYNFLKLSKDELASMAKNSNIKLSKFELRTKNKRYIVEKILGIPHKETA